MKSIKNEKATVRFAFKDSLKLLENKKNQESLIFLHFSFDGKRMKYSTGYKSCYADWNYDKQRIKTNKAGILNAEDVNASLSQMETLLIREYSRWKAEGIKVDKKIIKDYLDKITNKNNKSEAPKDFWSFIDVFLELREKQVKLVTIGSYKQTINQLKEFQKKYQTPIDYDTFDMNFYFLFIEYLENEDFALNTIGKHIKNIKVFLNYALNEGFSSNTKFKRSEFKVLAEQTTAIYLNEEEIEKIHKVDLSYDNKLERARDLFLIGCYTGQRISDFNRLSKDQIITNDGIDFFRVKQKKTGKIVHCPITKEMKDIFKRYKNSPPPIMHDQKINEFIKDVGRKIGLKDMEHRFLTKGGKPVGDQIPKYKLISSHTARRSFCSNMYKKKMPVFDIMLFSGHSSEKEFYNYIRIKDEERASHIVKSGYFNV